MSIREIWREAAMRDQLQFLGDYDPFLGRKAPGPVTQNRAACEGEKAFCALTILLGDHAFTQQALVCPACETEKAWAHPTDLMIHLNNFHRWGWLDLANKFPPILPEDQP